MRTDTRVTHIDEAEVSTSEGTIDAATVIWAAGVAASPLGQALGGETDAKGRVLVNTDLSMPTATNVFVIGDLAHIAGPDGTPLPGVAPVAQQGGDHVGACLASDLEGRQRPTFVYRDKGSMATGRSSDSDPDFGP